MRKYAYLHKLKYIQNDDVIGTDKISGFRLIDRKDVNKGKVALRVNIPQDLLLIKHSHSYSTSDDQRTLDELGYDVVYYHTKPGRGKWKVHNEHKGTRLGDIHIQLDNKKQGDDIQ